MAQVDKSKYVAASSSKGTTKAKGYTKEQVQQAQGKPAPVQTPQATPQLSEEQINQMIAEIIKMLQQGVKPEDILAKLVQSGIPQQQAQELIQKATEQVQSQQAPAAPAEQQPTEMPQ